MIKLIKDHTEFSVIKAFKGGQRFIVSHVYESYQDIQIRKAGGLLLFTAIENKFGRVYEED